MNLFKNLTYKKQMDYFNKIKNIFENQLKIK